MLKLISIFILIVIILMLIKVLYKKFYMNYLYKQYTLCQHNYHHINEDYIDINNKSIDRQTFLDLELDDVFNQIDYTRTTIGGEYLLNSIYHGNEKISMQEKYINHMDDESIKQILFAFHHLEKDHVSLFDLKKNIEAFHFKYLIVASILVLSFILTICLLFIDISYIKYVLLISLINIIFSMQFLLQSCKNLNQQIIFIRKIISTIQKVLKTNLKNEISQETRQAVNKLNKTLTIEKILSYLDNYDLFDILTIIDSLFFIRYFQAYFLKKHIDLFYNDLMICYEEIGLIDQSLSVKILRENFEVCIPKITHDKKIIIKNGYHPLIENPVKNSLVIDQNIVITGSNASGKSTFLRVLGVNFILAKAIYTCFADELIYYPYKLMTSIHMKDDILLGDSYYVSEIKRFEMICQRCNDEYLILIDEILKGTNEKERIVIARSIMSYLFKSHSLTIVTTHDTGLAESFNVLQYCFYDIKTPSGIKFDYRIKKGICRLGNAIEMMKQLQFDSEILDNL